MTAAVAPPAPPLGPEVLRPASPPRNRRTPYLAPVPSSEPPFDDERTVGQEGSAAADRPVAARSLATHTTSTRHTSPRTGSTGAVAILPRGTAQSAEKRSGSAGPTTIAASDVPAWSSEADIGVRRTATEHLPPARRAASVLARALVEVLSSRRPVAQLRVHCAPDIYAGLLERPFAGHQALPHLLNVRVCEPADGVAEVSAVFRRADRVRAIAFRIQGVDGRWRITALQLG